MKNEMKTEFPIVFVHGMFGWGQDEGINRILPYWGATTGNLVDYLSGLGIESYAASVGPMSSAWDEACELYARLTGTRVDYGEAHSKKFGHKRFGRTYEKPLFEGWSDKRKVHLIGHSFGGNACRMFAHILSHGAPEEAEISGNDVSPFFLGGKENLICSLTAICSPLNGTLAYESAKKHKLISPLKFLAYNYAGIVGRLPTKHSFANFHLEQFGLTDTPNCRDKEPFIKTFKRLFKTNDNIAFDMMNNGAKILNETIRISDSVYYFSYRFNAVNSEKNKADNTDFIFLKATSALMLHDGKKAGREPVGNDGLVDVDSAKHPKTEPFTEFSSESEIKPGVWNVMPEQIGDHGTPIGLFADKFETHSFYGRHILLLSKIEKKSAIAADS